MNKALHSLFVRIYDATIAPAFAAPGFRLRSKNFDPDSMPADLTGRRFVVTGANGGIGLAITEGLAERGATVVMACRDRARAEEARTKVAERCLDRGDRSGSVLDRDEVIGRLPIVNLDLASLRSVRDAAEAIGELGAIDALVHNAGMLVHERRLTEDGLEATFSVHVVAPFLLTHLLAEPLADRMHQDDPARTGRVIFVSSGGMYGQPLGLSRLPLGVRSDESPDGFDGVKQYARCKRAQVILARMMHRSGVSGRSNIFAASMHPGWVDTPGVVDALPGFYDRMSKWLRTPEQGADTAVWLASAYSDYVEGGAFYLDRDARPETLAFGRYGTSAEDEAALWALCERSAGSAFV